jgi:hypothetical protein
MEQKTEKSASKKSKAPPSAYKDPMGITTDKLDFGLWYILHLKRLRKVLIGFLIATAVFSWGYFFYGFLSYIFIGMTEDQALVDNAVKTRVASHEYFESVKAKSLEISEVRALANGTTGTYDFLAEIKNPNSRHWAEINYAFRSNNIDLPEKKDFILPGEEKMFVLLSEELESFPFNPEFVIKDIAWHPLKAKEIPDWQSFRDARLNFAIDNINWSLGEDSRPDDKIKFANVQFAVANKTAYNYWNVDFLVLLYQGERVASISSYAKDNFMSGQSYDIALTWPTSVSYASEIKIIPRLNIMRDDIYADFSGQPGIGQEGR